ncbi:MAG: undecaprenyl-phosphate glucose phosphotransferase [Candidatus Aureabacteria bacterium]|nr:undecaprenyl-phosphate glucose phosphotransferase [Candidatus Auribacterota bacterium]
MKRYKRTFFFSLLTIFSDCTAFFLSFLLTFWFRFHTGLFASPKGIPPLTDYLGIFPLLMVIFLAVFKSFNLYRERRFFEITLEAGKIFKAFAFSIMIFLLLSYFYRGTTYSRLYLILFVPIGFFSITAFRQFELKIEKILQKKYLRKNNILILGSGPDVEKLESALRKDYSWGFEKLMTACSKELFKNEDDMTTLEKSFREWKKANVNEIILVSRNIAHEQMIKIIYQCEKHLFSFHIAPDIFNIITSRVDIISIDGISLLELKRSPLDMLHNRIIKRLMDIFGAVIGLCIFSPLMLFVSYFIKRDSPGPIFYRQERCGEDGKDFVLLKFRTMFIDAEVETGPVFAKENDPRRTRVGKWLRSKNLDEIPQLINVLKGDMSLVGPRPERPHFVEKFKENIPKYMSRHLVKSGITGWAQVHGLRGNTSIEERIKYDLFYIENWSVFLDIKILSMTLFSKKNAY